MTDRDSKGPAKRLVSRLVPSSVELTLWFVVAAVLSTLSAAVCETTGCGPRASEFWLGAAFALSISALVVSLSVPADSGDEG